MSALQIQFDSRTALELTTDLLVLGTSSDAIADGQLRLEVLTQLDERLGGVLAEVVKQAEFEGKAGSEVSLHTHGKIAARRVVLLGLGAADKLDRDSFRLAAGKAVQMAERVKATSVALALPFDGKAANIEATAEGVLLGSYKFDRYLSDKKPAKLATVVLAAEATDAAAAALQFGRTLAESTNWARDLVNEPARVITPASLADAASKMAKGAGLEIKVHDHKWITKQKMGMFVGVAQGSEEKPTFIHVIYTPEGAGKDAAPVVLVGKAITFDSGGLSLKTGQGMETMKCDMAGSAAVLGAMQVIAALKPAFPVHALIGACENMPSGTAQKPGDIVVARNGKTVEVLNTDAEGRLVLGDVLSYAVDELKPAAVVDLATLTGAILTALGPYMTGLFSPDDALAGQLLCASAGAGEEMWRMPMPENLKELIKSPIADLKNIGGPKGGSITAALFLKEFVGNASWAHLDIAGSSFLDKEKGVDPRGGTGAGVRTLVEWIRNRSAAAAAPAEAAPKATRKSPRKTK